MEHQGVPTPLVKLVIAVGVLFENGGVIVNESSVSHHMVGAVLKKQIRLEHRHPAKL